MQRRAVTWSTARLPNLSEIEQSAAELLRFQYLTLWPWTCVTCCDTFSGNFHEFYTQSTYLFVTCNDFRCWYPGLWSRSRRLGLETVSRCTNVSYRFRLEKNCQRLGLELLRLVPIPADTLWHHGRRARGDGDKSPQNLERVDFPPDFVMLQNFKHLHYHVGKCVFCLYSSTFVVSPAMCLPPRITVRSTPMYGTLWPWPLTRWHWTL